MKNIHRPLFNEVRLSKKQNENGNGKRLGLVAEEARQR